MTQMYYDTETDVLYLSIGDPRPAVTEEAGDDVLLRLDLKTGAIIGLTMLNFSARFSSLDAPQTLPVQIELHKPA